VGIAIIVASAVGCDTAVYDKPGITYAQYKRDDAECRAVARSAQAERVDPTAHARCMRARGYTLSDR
jgi:hypothetical protein